MSESIKAIGKGVGRYRWVICGLLFLATTVNYVDRQVIGVLKVDLARSLGWSQVDYSNIVVAFQLAYAIGLLVAGRFIDRIGVRRGYGWAVVLWSLAAMAHGLVVLVPRHQNLTLDSSSTVHSFFIILLYGSTTMATYALPLTVFWFGMARFGLGLTEAANFPACIKAVGEWFPKKERALATGIFNAGTNVGALITPLIVPWITLHWGWPAAFYWTGSLGFLWVIAWAIMYRSPDHNPRLSKAELDYIRSDPQDPAPPKIPWLSLLGHRQTWAFLLGKFMTDPVWWLYLFWVPDFLHTRHGLNLKDFGPPLVVIYLMTDVGSIAGGWMSSKLIKIGWTVNKARKITMLTCALCVVPIMLASVVSNLWVAVVLIGIAASAHQGWSANIFTLVSDTVPKHAVSSVTGIGGMAGAVGGMLIAKAVGYILQATNNNYLIPFIIASVMYLVALAVIHLLNPRLEPMKFKNQPPAS